MNDNVAMPDVRRNRHLYMCLPEIIKMSNRGEPIVAIAAYVKKQTEKNPNRAALTNFIKQIRDPDVMRAAVEHFQRQNEQARMASQLFSMMSQNFDGSAEDGSLQPGVAMASVSQAGLGMDLQAQTPTPAVTKLTQTAIAPALPAAADKPSIGPRKMTEAEARGEKMSLWLTPELEKEFLAIPPFDRQKLYSQRIAAYNSDRHRQMMTPDPEHIRTLCRENGFEGHLTDELAIFVLAENVVPEKFRRQKQK